VQDVDLPIKFRGEVFGDKLFIVGSQLGGITRIVAFAVKIVRVEGPYCLEGFQILLICEVAIGAFAVPAV